MTDMSTPRERIEKFIESIHPRAKYAAVADPARPLLAEDLRAVLSANKGYESLMRNAAREAVAEYKKNLAAELRNRVATTPSPDHFWVMGLQETADDLEDGTL